MPSRLFRALCPAPVLRIGSRALQRLGADNAAFLTDHISNALHGEREYHLLKFLCNSRKISIDAGVAQGHYFRRLQKLSLACIGFEPNPIQYAQLQKRFSGAQIENCALSDRSGEVELRVPIVRGVSYDGYGTIETSNTLSDFGGCPQRRFTVKTCTLDEFEITNVGFVKIDVEGHEIDALNGAVRTIAACRPNFLIESEERHRSGATAAVFKFFQDRSYRGCFLHAGRPQDVSEFHAPTHQNLPPHAGRYTNNFIFFPAEKFPEISGMIET
ncbi:MAG: FkbM family methyltransferase [Hyphomicrobiales bacterium]